jgi:hypothetical protein
VTVPACWYLLSNAPDTSHGHGDHDDAHGKSHEEEEVEEPKDESEKSEEGEEKEDNKDNEKSEDSDSDDEKKEEDTPDTSDDEGKEAAKKPADDLKFKGPTQAGDERKHIPDAKGGAKKSIKQGEATDSGSDSSGPKDKVREHSAFAD